MNWQYHQLLQSPNFWLSDNLSTTQEWRSQPCPSSDWQWPSSSSALLQPPMQAAPKTDAVTVAARTDLWFSTDGTDHAAIQDTSATVLTTPVRAFTMAPALTDPSTITDTSILQGVLLPASELCGRRIPNIFYTVNVGQLQSLKYKQFRYQVIVGHRRLQMQSSLLGRPTLPNTDKFSERFSMHQVVQ